MPPEYRAITVELQGRVGYNALAVNGVWRVWRVRAGRLAFFRDAEFQMDPSEHTEHTEAGGVAGGEAAATQRGLATVRLYLFYMQPVDSWVISDTPGITGSIVADCGPVGQKQDLAQAWRVWDGESKWCEDGNITAEIALGGPVPPGLQGLQLVRVERGAARPRAHSHDARGAAVGDDGGAAARPRLRSQPATKGRREQARLASTPAASPPPLQSDRAARGRSFSLDAALRVAQAAAIGAGDDGWRATAGSPS